MKPLVFLFALTVSFSGIINAQNLDDILTSHLDAIGQHNLSKVNGLKISGTAVQMGREMPFFTIQKRPDKIYNEIDIEGTRVIHAFDGTTGWALEPWVSEEPRELNEDELANVVRTADIDSDLYNWRRRGRELHLVGVENFEGREVYKLELFISEEYNYLYYLDTETFLITKIVNRSLSPGGEMFEGETRIAEYIRVNDMMFPARTEFRLGGQLQMISLVDEVTIDPDMDDDVFSMPND
ncbi:MAG: hypothetical protein EA408_05275 [Marinilabiliales bacterium]|nr:MAG: hypothetical protein EA408_05275 [Marinilabiliales bacterium]